jgi:hypothetical protein
MQSRSGLPAPARQPGEHKLFEFVVGVELITFISSTQFNEFFRFIAYEGPASSSTVSPVLTDLIESCIQFGFPDREQFLLPDKSAHILASERFSFVLTDSIGRRYFGYVLRYFDANNPMPRAFVLLSALPCFALYSHMLQELVGLSNQGAGYQRCTTFLDSVRACSVPEPGETFDIPALATWKFVRPDETDAPLEYIDFQPLLRKFRPKTLIRIFCSMLLERRFIFLARHLSTLCSVVQAAVALLYPFTWHHAYIPVMPKSMVDVCSAPIPYIVGMPTATFAFVKQHELELDIVVVDIDGGEILTPLNGDVDFVPKKLVAYLQNLLISLSPDRSLAQRFRKSVATMTKLASDKKEVITEEPVDLIPPKEKTQRLLSGFLTFFVTLLSGYRHHFQPSTNLYDFDKASFVAEAHPDLRRFLAKVMETQMFEQFIAHRAKKYTATQGTFDQRTSSWRQSLYFQEGVIGSSPPYSAANSRLLTSLDLDDRVSRFSKFHDESAIKSLLDLEDFLESSKAGRPKQPESSSSTATKESLFTSRAPGVRALSVRNPSTTTTGFSAPSPRLDVDDSTMHHRMMRSSTGLRNSRTDSNSPGRHSAKLVATTPSPSRPGHTSETFQIPGSGASSSTRDQRSQSISLTPAPAVPPPVRPGTSTPREAPRVAPQPVDRSTTTPPPVADRSTTTPPPVADRSTKSPPPPPVADRSTKSPPPPIKTVTLPPPPVAPRSRSASTSGSGEDDPRPHVPPRRPLPPTPKTQPFNVRAQAPRPLPPRGNSSVTKPSPASSE